MATYWENSCSFGLRYVSWYKYLIVGLVFSHLGFWSGNLFLIAPFPDLCLLVPFSEKLKDCGQQLPHRSTDKQFKFTYEPLAQVSYNACGRHCSAFHTVRMDFINYITLY